MIHEIILSGLGGKGVLVSGQLLVQAGSLKYEHVSYYQAYTTLMRGGVCECTVVLSDDPVASPLLDQAGTVIVLEPSQAQAFEGRVSPGGVIILESTGLSHKIERDDVRVLQIPGVKIAADLGSIQAANLVILGTYIGVTKALPPELIEEELSKKFTKDESVLARNKEAFRKGLGLAEVK